MPFYANTHTEGNICGEQTTRFVHEARAVVKACVQGTDEGRAALGIRPG
jgi:selenocysteine lyase/cysteine desulfurase